jgi:hypothetical protein
MRLLALRLRAQYRRRPTARSQRAGLDHLLRIAAEQAAATGRPAPDAVAADAVAAGDAPDGALGAFPHG